MRWFNRALVLERLRLLRQRAAVPPLVLAGLALVRQAAYSWDGAVIVWRWVQSVPMLAWLTSSTGLLVLALFWVGFLLVRPSSWVGSDGWRVERVRTLIREAVAAVHVRAVDIRLANHSRPRSTESLRCLRVSLDCTHAGDR